MIFTGDLEEEQSSSCFEASCWEELASADSCADERKRNPTCSENGRSLTKLFDILTNCRGPTCGGCPPTSGCRRIAPLRVLVSEVLNQVLVSTEVIVLSEEIIFFIEDGLSRKRTDQDKLRSSVEREQTKMAPAPKIALLSGKRTDQDKKFAKVRGRSAHCCS